MKIEGETRRSPGVGGETEWRNAAPGAMITQLGDAASVNSTRYVTTIWIWREVVSGGSLYDFINIHPGDPIMTRPCKKITNYSSSVAPHCVTARTQLTQLLFRFKGSYRFKRGSGISPHNAIWVTFCLVSATWWRNESERGLDKLPHFMVFALPSKWDWMVKFYLISPGTALALRTASICFNIKVSNLLNYDISFKASM